MHDAVVLEHHVVMGHEAVDQDCATNSLFADQTRADHSYVVTRRHGAVSWLLMLTTEGRGWATTGTERVLLEPGRLALLAPHVPHQYGALGSWGIRWAHFRARDWWVDLLGWAPVSPGLSVIDLSADELRACEAGLIAARSAVDAGGRLADELGLAHLETVILTGARACSRETPGDPRVAAAVDLLRRKVDRPYRAQDVADAMHLSPGRAAKLFTVQVGVSPQRYATVLKVERARRLLELSDLSVRRVARATGFDNESYFSRRFHQEVGTAPSAYRALHRV